jgi:hypothetical protein
VRQLVIRLRQAIKDALLEVVHVLSASVSVSRCVLVKPIACRVAAVLATAEHYIIGGRNVIGFIADVSVRTKDSFRLYRA